VAFETPVLDFTLIAAADLSGSQFFLVDVDGSGAGNVAGKAALSLSGASALGVVQNKPSSGQATQIRTEGITKVVAGAAFASGALVMSDANGRAIAVTAGSYAIGKALTAATALGDVVTIKLATYGKN